MRVAGIAVMRAEAEVAALLRCRHGDLGRPGARRDRTGNTGGAGVAHEITAGKTAQTRLLHHPFEKFRIKIP